MTLAELTALRDKILAFTTAVKNKHTSKYPTATSADNALAFVGQTPAQFATALLATLNGHIQDLNNPHQDTAAGIGSVSGTDIDTTVASKLGQGLLPVSVWTGTTTATGTTVSITSTDVIMAGRVYSVADAAIDLTSLGVPLASATLYLYLVLKAGIPSFEVSASKLAESDTLMYLGTITLDAAGTTATVATTVVRRLGIYRISATGQGSSIMASVGEPYTAL